MPKFVQEIIENYFWSEASYCEAMLNETSFEIPDFPSGSEEEFRIPDAFVLDEIETM